MSFRWAGSRASALISLPQAAREVRLVYRLPPEPVEAVQVAARAVGAARDAWRAEIAWTDGLWHERAWRTVLPEGDYEVRLNAPQAWVARGKEERGISLAVSSLLFTPVLDR